MSVGKLRTVSVDTAEARRLASAVAAALGEPRGEAISAVVAVLARMACQLTETKFDAARLARAWTALVPQAIEDGWPEFSLRRAQARDGGAP